LPEYLAPGVFVEETSFNGRAIDGVSTSTAAFVGMTADGPIGEVSALITTYADFERTYGGDDDLVLAGGPQTNHMAHAVRGFFDNGGTRLYVARVSPPQTPTKLRSNGFRGFFRRMMQLRFATKPVPTITYRDALELLEDIDDVSIIAAPGATMPNLQSVHAELISHAEKMQHRFAVLDPPPNQTSQEVSALASSLDSSHAALYYPWFVDAASGGKAVPPSGAVCGIYARTDRERGVWKAPAGTTIMGITGFERDIDEADQDTLNPAGVNVSRSLSGRGLRLNGARTLSSDPEWRYVSVRRYMSFLEKSISDGIDWAVFEPNDEPLWSVCRNRVENFLSDSWRQGALQGQKASDAFFVRCDRTTMTQADIDSGRLIVQVGVAIVRPAEFQIFRIQKTLSSAQ